MVERQIRQEERDLIVSLLKKISKETEYPIPEYIFEMDDGGMGSLKLNSGIHARDLIQVKYIDTDGQMVIITLTENNSKELFELDVWKVDFNPLNKFPLPDQVEILLID